MQITRNVRTDIRIYLVLAAAWCFFVAILPYTGLGDGPGIQEYLRTTIIRTWAAWKLDPTIGAIFLAVFGSGLVISSVLAKTYGSNGWHRFLPRLYMLVFLFAVLLVTACVLLKALHNMFVAAIPLALAIARARKGMKDELPLVQNSN